MSTHAQVLARRDPDKEPAEGLVARDVKYPCLGKGLEENIIGQCFTKDGNRLNDEWLDELKKHINGRSNGTTVFCDHDQHQPVVSGHYNHHVEYCEGTPMDQPTRLSFNAKSIAVNQNSHLYKFPVVDVNNRLLNRVSVENKDESSILLLNRYPMEGGHSFVALVQKERSYKRFQIEKLAYKVVCSQPDFSQKNPCHIHDGYNAMFGNHHSYRSYIGPYQTRKFSSDKVIF